MINLVELLASGLGVKLGEPFDIVAFDGGEDVVEDNPYSFTRNALVDAHGNPADEGIIDNLVTGAYVVSKYTIWDSLKLCYADANTLCFTDRTPKDTEKNKVRLRIGFASKADMNIRIVGSKSGFSVDDVNNGAVAWLYHDKIGGLYGGTSVADSIVWLQKAGCEWGELHE